MSDQLRWLCCLVFCVHLPTSTQSNLGPGHRLAVTALAVSPDGAALVVGSQRGVELQAWAGERTRAVDTDLEHVHDLVFSPDGRTLAVAGGSPAEFGVVELWSWPDRKLIGQVEGHDDVVYGVAWVGAERIATCSADRSVRVWDVATGKEITNLRGHSGPVLCVAVSPDLSLLCTGSTDQTIRVWDTRAWQLVRTFTNHLGPVHGLAFKPVARVGEGSASAAELASAGSDGTVRIWQPAIGRMVRIVKHALPVFTVAWIDDKTIVSGSKEGLSLIDAASGEVGNRPNGDQWIMSLAVSPDRRRIAAGTACGTVKVISSAMSDR